MASSGTLVVSRTAGHDVKERELYVSIDGGPNTIMRFGDSVEFPLEPGHHRLRVHNTWSRQTDEFDLAPGEIIRFSAVNVPGRHYHMMGMFFGFALMHTELRREP